MEGTGSSDFNGDGTVNAADVVSIYQAIIGDSAKSCSYKALSKKFIYK